MNIHIQRPDETCDSTATCDTTDSATVRQLDAFLKEERSLGSMAFVHTASGKGEVVRSVADIERSLGPDATDATVTLTPAMAGG